MHTFKIVSDSSCDVPSHLLEQYEIDLVPYYVSLDKENYLRENIDITITEFYQAMITKRIYPKTSLPPIADYIEIFKNWLEKGMDILCICLSSKFSGSYQSATNAKNILLEDFPDRKILVVDSMQATQVQGFIVIEAAKQKQLNKTIEETADYICRLRTESTVFFTVDTLEYLQQGGRVGKASALAGSILNIKPIIWIKDGELIPVSKVRGRKKAIAEVFQLVESFTNGKTNAYQLGIVHSHCLEDAEALKKSLIQEFGITDDLPIYEIGVTIGTHVGPATIGIAVAPKKI